MNKFSDMITNLEATFGYVVTTIIYAIIENKGGFLPAGFIMGAIGFSALEVIVHIFFGVKAYFFFKKDGKTTIYGPGSITAYLEFGVFGFIQYYILVDRIKAKLFYSYGWIIMVGVRIFIGVFCVLGPENIVKRKNSKYIFKTNGYFDRFLNKEVKRHQT